MRFAFVSGNRVSKFVSMNKLAKALAIIRPDGDFSRFDFITSDDMPIGDSDFESLRKLHFDALLSLGRAYGETNDF